MESLNKRRWLCTSVVLLLLLWSVEARSYNRHHDFGLLFSRSQRTPPQPSSLLQRIISSTRGGESSSTDAEEEYCETDVSVTTHTEEQTATTTTSAETTTTTTPPQKKRKIRLASTVIRNILENELVEESMELRQLIERRAEEYVADLLVASSSSEEQSPLPKSPIKVLHYLAPKVAAIKHSPDFMLRIQTARGDIDSGVAAAILVTMARLCILFDDRMKQLQQSSSSSVAKDIIKDRRFEQLVECVLCGVDVRKRKRQALLLDQGDQDDITFDMEELLDEEDVRIDEGLGVEDACRAAWGLAMMCGYTTPGETTTTTYGGQAVTDILMALSLRIRERLLARLQLLRQGELRYDIDGDQTLAEGLERDAERLSEDAAAAIWTFACVKASTGLKTVPLLEACCSILCQNPTQLREREQAKMNNTNIKYEVDDVVDRLAKSSEGEEETGVDEADSSADESTSPSSDDRDALVHWLSPSEVCGTMWAVALHGKTDSSQSSKQMNLTETAEALSEIAFDCIHEWLKDDLQALRNSGPAAVGADKTAATGTTSLFKVDETMEREVLSRGDGVVVEVVDAAALLAKEHLDAVAEDITAEQQVQVVDAATLLASQESAEAAEAMLASTSTTEAKHEELQTVVSSSTISLAQPQDVDLRFSNSELCSLAWAATDLQDSLCDILVDLISALLVEQGKQSLEDLDGGDLSDLSWAIARHMSQRDDLTTTENAVAETRMQELVHWVAERALSLVQNQSNDAILDHFQAPELGRILWSLATAVSNMSPRGAKNVHRGLPDFALVGLKIASTNSSMFGTEDLARIVWGFVELNELDDVVVKDPMVSVALGRIVEIMESSILRWESGQCEKSRREKESIVHVEESMRFASFLGRPRLALRLLEQRLDTSVDEDDDTADSERSSHLPLLRDLSMDPATMCKLAYGLSRTKLLFPEIDGAWTFTRVAVRLLSSKQGQLLKVTPPADCVRLAFACATNDIPGYGREMVTRLYARRLVQRFNDMIGDSEHLYLSQRLGLSAEDMSTMIWSLGQLGARHWIQEENGEGVAYKRLRLVYNVSLLSTSQLASLPAQPTAQLLCGAVTMEMMSSSPETVISLLRALGEKLKTNEADDGDGVDICEVAECLSKIRAGETNVTTSIPIPLVVKNTTTTTPEEATPEGEGEVETVESSPNVVTTACNDLLQILAQSVNPKTLTVYELRRLLSVYVGLPFQADKLIDSIDVEIHKRLEAIRLYRLSRRTARRRRPQPPTNNDNDDSDDEAPLAALRHGLKKFFGHDDGGDQHEEEAKRESPQEIREEEHQQTSPTAVAMHDSSNDLFDLSRCQELVASYRRVNFEIGKRQSRKDKSALVGIGRKVISRKFNLGKK